MNKDATYYRHQVIHKQSEVDAAKCKLRRLADDTERDLERALIALTERHPPKLEVVEYILRELRERHAKHAEVQA
tara:strand:- start:889 stop:1113 length:225 start_codon:yes stop_codon:yes gene_type:complete